MRILHSLFKKMLVFLLLGGSLTNLTAQQVRINNPQTEEEFESLMPVNGSVSTFSGDYELDHSIPTTETSKRLYEKGDGSKISPDHVRKVSHILTVLEAAEQIEDVDLITFRLHRLSGDRKNSWSVTVKANWRITFEFNNGRADNINYEDYH